MEDDNGERDETGAEGSGRVSFQAEATLCGIELIV